MMEIEMKTQTQAEHHGDEDENTLQWKRITNRHEHQNVRKV
jgi:hypothetical protein